MSISTKACPFVARECLREGCLAWSQADCRLLSRAAEGPSSFDLLLRNAAPLMYRSLLDLVKVMEELSGDCRKCGPELWNYAQQVRGSLLDELIKSELAEVGIKSNMSETDGS
ncbi:MAG: hypothetical protein GYA39_09490 [Methanothrix sp.]|nr:hypothetical protein [Methanothrix sp.]